MKNIQVLLILSVAIFLYSTPVIAQEDLPPSGDGEISIATSTPTVEEQINDLLASLSSLEKTLKKERGRSSKTAAKKVKLIAKKIERAINSIPPEKCYEGIKIAMNDFFALVSKLNRGISCGPPIIPPFLDREDEVLTGDCALPPEKVFPDQLGIFGEVNPVYDTARSLFHIDEDGSGISDACEGTN